MNTIIEYTRDSDPQAFIAEHPDRKAAASRVREAQIVAADISDALAATIVRAFFPTAAEIVFHFDNDVFAEVEIASVYDADGKVLWTLTVDTYANGPFPLPQRQAAEESIADAYLGHEPERYELSNHLGYADTGARVLDVTTAVRYPLAGQRTMAHYHPSKVAEVALSCADDETAGVSMWPIARGLLRDLIAADAAEQGIDASPAAVTAWVTDTLNRRAELAAYHDEQAGDVR